MNEQVKASAKLAREFLQMITEGIGKLEGGASEFARTGASHLARQLPAKWKSGGGGGSTRTIALLVAAGVVASTAALIYSRTRGGKEAARRRRRR
jgi:hypothetical protein